MVIEAAVIPDHCKAFKPSVHSTEVTKILIKWCSALPVFPMRSHTVFGWQTSNHLSYISGMKGQCYLRQAYALMFLMTQKPMVMGGMAIVRPALSVLGFSSGNVSLSNISSFSPFSWTCLQKQEGKKCTQQNETGGC